jgi:hypothetical protein
LRKKCPVTRRSAIEKRTTRHPGSAARQRKRIAETFAWTRTIAGLRKNGLPLVFIDAIKDKGTTFEAFETEFFTSVRPTSLIKRFATPGEVASLVGMWRARSPRRRRGRR